MMSLEIAEFKRKLESLVGYLADDINKIRGHRATPTLVEDIVVEAYNTKTLLKGLASISTPDAKTIIIEPWDKSILEAIAKAVGQASLGTNPVVDGQAVRINLPPLVWEKREALVKLVSQKVEEARIKSRRLRDELVKSLQHQEKDHTISQDEKFRKKEDADKAIKQFNEKIEELRARKEKELMEI